MYIEETPRYLAYIKLVTHEPATAMMIGSFAQDRDDLTLWDRYTDQSRGCVVGIDAHWLATRAGVAIRRISYDETYLKEFVNARLLMLQEQFEKEPSNIQLLKELATSFVLDLYAFKDPRFHSEAEIRISRLTVFDDTAEFGLRDVGGIRDDESAAPLLPVKQRDGPYGATRFIELPLGDNETRSAIKSIGFGPRFDKTDETSIRHAMPDGSNVEFWASDIPLR